MTRNVAFTAPGADDERLRGRTYAIPFQDVWQASLDLAGGELKRWEVTEHDDHEGVIQGRVRGRLPRRDSRITIRITLDENAQTRVDVRAMSEEVKADLGSNARRIHRFYKALDRSLTESRT